MVRWLATGAWLNERVAVLLQLLGRVELAKRNIAAI
jgi:hypothetical protein